MNKVAIYPGTFDPITFGHIVAFAVLLKIFSDILNASSKSSGNNIMFITVVILDSLITFIK